MEAALIIARYLKAHPGRDLFYGVHGHLRIEVFTDSNWVGSPSDKRSTTGGYCTFLGGNLITWKSKKQDGGCSVWCGGREQGYDKLCITPFPRDLCS